MAPFPLGVSGPSYEGQTPLQGAQQDVGTVRGGGGWRGVLQANLNSKPKTLHRFFF